jgi:hypothetical protein
MIATFRRGLRAGRLAGDDYNRILWDFKSKWDDFYIPEVDSEHIERSGKYAEQYALKGCDAFRLSSAIVSHTNIFVCSGHDLINAAEDEGLMVWNPGLEPNER